jgi:mRNA-degrading endonuclease RelE of RelBE toxin-antitoxin system
MVNNNDKTKPFVSRKDRENKKQIYQKVEVEKVIVKISDDQRTLEIIIPPKHKDFLEKLKSRIKELCKTERVSVEFQGGLVAEKKKKGDNGLYKLRLSKTRVKFDGGEGVVISIADKNDNYQDYAVINKKKEFDSVIGIKLDNDKLTKKKMSQLEVIEF